MLAGKRADKYLSELIAKLGWQEALQQLERDIKSGYVVYKDTGSNNALKRRLVPEWVDDDEVDEWLEFNANKSISQETYFIIVSDKQGIRHTIFVDESDYTKVSEYDWWVKRDDDGYYYAVTNVDGKFISLQQFILGIPDEWKRIIFKDKNKLNVKRNNMKIRKDEVRELRFKQKFGYDFK